jgi:hypothetical protein
MKPGPLWEKKDKHCDPNNPADREQGSYWDQATAHAAFLDFYERTDGGLPELITTDAYAPYLSIILSVYGVRKEDLGLSDAEKAELDWANWPAVYFPVEIAYATVHKERENGRVVKVERQVVLGTESQVAAALSQGPTAPTINTNYVERWNGTNRHFNARKARKVYTFSKELVFHVAVTWLCVVFYNFGWQPQPLRQKIQEEPPRYHYRTPAMAAGLTQTTWSWQRILTYPIYDRKCLVKPPKRRRRKKKS